MYNFYMAFDILSLYAALSTTTIPIEILQRNIHYKKIANIITHLSISYKIETV